MALAAGEPAGLALAEAAAELAAGLAAVEELVAAGALLGLAGAAAPLLEGVALPPQAASVRQSPTRAGENRMAAPSLH